MNVFFDTIGCRLNQAEIEQMAVRFMVAGHTIVASAQAADLVVINTCAVTAAAASDSRQKARQANHAGARRIYLTGCWATLKPEEAAALDGVSDVILNQDKMELPSRILEQSPQNPQVYPNKREPLPGAHRRTRAFIKAQDGCDNHCTFCVTRLARGNSKSVERETILDDILAAEAGGVREVVLSGVNLGSWGNDLGKGETVSDLISFLLNNSRVERIRLSSVEPWDLDERFFELWKNPRMCRHLHLPLQSGSRGVLKRMARKTTPQAFEDLVKMARSAIPGVAITTDIMVGFPGETEDEYRESLRFVEKMSFSGGHVFRFSPREGTAAANLPGRVNGSVTKERAAEVAACLKSSEKAFLLKAVGQITTVLWEGSAKKDGQRWLIAGLTDNYMKVRVRSEDKRWNSIDRVKIDGFENGSLFGHLVEEDIIPGGR